MPRIGRILVVDDDASQIEFLRTILRADGWEVASATSAGTALAVLDRGEDVDVILSDLLMPGMDGRALLAAVLERRPEVPVIILTAHASVDSAVELLHAGAWHYLAKPPKVSELRLVARRAREATETHRELARLRRRLNVPADVVGVSRAMRDVLEAAIRVAPTSTPVLITGEPGTGKEVVARAIHSASGRGTFVALNCAAIPPDRFDAELFGASRAPGESHAPSGAAEMARGGTVFLDDVTDVPLASQPGLGRFVQTGRYTHGGAEARSDARILAATSRDPALEVTAGRFTPELLAQLDVVRLHLPPLRERAVDIPALATHLLERLAARFQLERAELAPDALAAITSYPWPGNIRELENALARAVAVRGGRAIGLRDLPAAVARGTPVAVPTGPILTLEEVERRHILQVLDRTGGNKLKTAELLGIDRSTLHRKLKQLQGLTGARGRP